VLGVGHVDLVLVLVALLVLVVNWHPGKLFVNFGDNSLNLLVVKRLCLVLLLLSNRLDFLLDGQEVAAELLHFA